MNWKKNLLLIMALLTMDFVNPMNIQTHPLFMGNSDFINREIQIEREPENSIQSSQGSSPDVPDLRLLLGTSPNIIKDSGYVDEVNSPIGKYMNFQSVEDEPIDQLSKIQNPTSENKHHENLFTSWEEKLDKTFERGFLNLPDCKREEITKLVPSPTVLKNLRIPINDILGYLSRKIVEQNQNANILGSPSIFNQKRKHLIPVSKPTLTKRIGEIFAYLHFLQSMLCSNKLAREKLKISQDTGNTLFHWYRGILLHMSDIPSSSQSINSEDSTRTLDPQIYLSKHLISKKKFSRKKEAQISISLLSLFYTENCPNVWNESLQFNSNVISNQKLILYFLNM